jgi:class 3 adenylate cyclase/tetratricopeptide (TPR) repeat protein
MQSPACPQCGAFLPEAARFCAACGCAVAPDARADLGGERRQLTVMFADLVDSTGLSERLDAEDYSEVVSAYQSVCAERVAHFEGRVAQYLGDGVLAYFGHPSAHEDDAARAVSAALGIRDALPALNERLRREVPALGAGRLAVRIGIATGLVVIGGDAAGEDGLARGTTVILAARLQELALPGQVVVSETTRRLTQGRFITEDLGAHGLKGIDEPVRVWRAQRPIHPGGRLEPAHDLTPLVGREPELARLDELWRESQSGRARAVVVTAEPGLGKSRLIHAFRERLAGEPYTWVECQCSPYHRNTALYPIAGVLERAASVRREDSSQAKIASLERALEGWGFPLDETLPLLAGLLSLPLPADRPVPDRTPAEFRRHTFEWLLEWFKALADARPVVLAVEDLHWADPSSLEFFSFCLERAAQVPALYLFTTRPESPLPWSGAELLELRALSHAQARSMIAFATAQTPQSDEVVRQLIERADGVPLFIEELAQSVVESAGAGARVAIPESLQASLMARLDRLGVGKSIAQLAAVIGRDFDPALLEPVAGLPPGRVDAALEELTEAGVLAVRGDGAGRYSFRHSLIRDAAYESLLKSSRRRLHAAVASAIGTHFPDLVASEPELIARHCERGGLIEQAVDHYRSAGELATRRSAHTEAARHLRRGLGLLEGLPESLERDERELQLQMSLGAPLIATGSYGDPDLERAYERALELSRRIGAGPPLFRPIFGLSTFYQARARNVLALELARQCLAIAEERGDSGLLLASHQRLGLCNYYRGDHVAALEHLDRAVALYDEANHRPLAELFGLDVGVSSMAYQAVARWVYGQPSQGRARIREAVQAARESGNPHTLAFILSFAGAFYQQTREAELALEHADEAVRISRQRGFPFWLGFGSVIAGWARSRVKGPGPDAVAEVKEGVDLILSIGMLISRLYSEVLLGDTQLQADQYDDAHETLAGAIRWGRERQCRFWEPEALRLQGEIFEARDAPERALACYRQASELAGSQQARSHELRAALNSARLLRRLGRAEEARTALDVALAYPEQDGGAPDLAAARELLAERD